MTEPRDLHLERARTLARWLDDRSLDPILGLLAPGAGDVAASAAGLYIVWVAIQRGMPAVAIARMMINLAVDAIVGSIPIAGDVFDFAFRANRRNLALLERPGPPGRSSATDWLIVIGAVLLFVAALAVPIWLIVRLAHAVLH